MAVEVAQKPQEEKAEPSSFIHGIFCFYFFKIIYTHSLN
jgi:hypothetical protein